jgi:hypothetical protein
MNARAHPADARDLGLLLAPLGLAAVTFWPILGNYFHADDFVDFFHVAAFPLGQYVMEEHGGHMYVVRNLVFALAWSTFGNDPRPYFALVLVTHVVNVALLFVVVRRLTGRAALASVVAALWGTAPVNERALGWFAVYGHVLAATMMLAVLADLARFVRDGAQVTAGRSALWAVALVVGSACFGVGIGTAVVFPVTALLLLPRGCRSRGATLILGALPLVVAALYVVWNVVRVSVYDASPKTVLFLVGMLRYVTGISAMLGHLFGAGTAELVLGGFTGAAHYPSLLAYAVVTAVAAGVILVARDARVGARRVAAFLVLALAMYGVIAAGRANLFGMRSQDWPKAATVGRYHYAPGIPLALLLALVGEHLAVRVPARRRRAVGVAVGVGLALALVARVRTPIRFDHHGYAREQTARVLEAIGSAIAATPPGGEVWIKNREFAAVRFFFGNGDFFGWASVFVLHYPDDVVDGRRVRFVESNPKILATVPATHSQRLATLLAPSAPPGPVH